MAIWIIAVLSVMVVSFAFEARQQAGINVYLRERNRVKRLIEPGRVLGEIVLLGYSEAKEWTEDEKEADMDEEDHFYKEKRDTVNQQPTAFLKTPFPPFYYPAPLVRLPTHPL